MLICLSSPLYYELFDVRNDNLIFTVFPDPSTLPGSQECLVDAYLNSVPLHPSQNCCPGILGNVHKWKQMLTSAQLTLLINSFFFYIFHILFFTSIVPTFLHIPKANFLFPKFTKKIQTIFFPLILTNYESAC